MFLRMVSWLALCVLLQGPAHKFCSALNLPPGEKGGVGEGGIRRGGLHEVVV